jgi:hypothetical protein
MPAQPQRTQVGDGVPWPTFADDTRYTVTRRAALPDGRTGWVLYVTWVDADGRYVNRANKNAGRLGDHWEAHVTLDDGGSARLPLSNLTPTDPDA